MPREESYYYASLLSWLAQLLEWMPSVNFAAGPFLSPPSSLTVHLEANGALSQTKKKLMNVFLASSLLSEFPLIQMQEHKTLFLNKLLAFFSTQPLQSAAIKTLANHHKESSPFLGGVYDLQMSDSHALHRIFGQFLKPRL